MRADDVDGVDEEDEIVTVDGEIGVEGESEVDTVGDDTGTCLNSTIGISVGSALSAVSAVSMLSLSSSELRLITSTEVVMCATGASLGLMSSVSVVGLIETSTEDLSPDSIWSVLATPIS